jgi:alginate O-acetyltransferase complex protein AlgI
MVFSSPVFLFLFLPIVYLLHLLLPAKARNALLLLASLFFYSWGEPVFVLLMILSAVVNYFLALKLDKIPLSITVIFNIGLLVIFKYTDFLIGACNQIFALSIPLPGIPLPIGISFFTFQAMSYVIDVKRGHAQVQRRLDHLMLYIAFFPQLIAGPIVKYHDIADQITNRQITKSDTAAGIRRFIAGLAKKLLIANYTGQIADQIFALNGHDLTMPAAWLGAIAYTLQIYFDFSGYSDMAIGLGRIFGFKFKENFTHPFAADSIQNFWRRWHISLSTWFKEYLYIPLGGNRLGKWRTGINRVVVFFFTGLWHGASWTFVVWGLIHGFFLLLESYGIIRTDKMWKPLRHIYTLLIVILSFVLFRADNFNQALDFLGSMFLDPTAQSEAASRLLMHYNTAATYFILPVALITSLPLVRTIRDRISDKPKLTRLFESTGYLCSLLLLAICVLALSAATYNPFIYFRF